MKRRHQNGGHVTLREIYELLDPIHTRVRRLEILVAAVLVSVTSPKVGGPSAPDAVAYVTNLII